MTNAATSAPPLPRGTLTVPEITDDMSTLDAALAYAAAGWYIGPAKAGTKNPGSVIGDPGTGKGWQRHTSRDPKLITSWFVGTNHGVFLHAGRSGAVIIDVDDPLKVTVPIASAITDTRPPCQSTRPDQPGRRHYLFLQPPGRIIGNSLGDLGGGWGDIRGLNGVIIVAPSIHKEGGHYQWHRTGPVPTLPGYVASRLPNALSAAETATDEQVTAFLSQATAGDRPDLLDIHVTAFTNRVAEGESRHQTMCGHLAGAMKEAKAGLLDAKEATDTLESVFLAAVATPPKGKQGGARTGAAATNEWRGILAWAVAQAKASDPEATKARVEAKVPDLDRIILSGATGPPDDDPEMAEFWDQEPILGHIRDFAYARLVSPWSLLGICMLRMMAVVKPSVTLPPIIGGKGSLNMFVAIVGPSGVGKGATESAARECLTFGMYTNIHTVAIGSGEGIAHQYKRFVPAKKNEPAYIDDIRDSVLFTITEVDTMTSLNGRQGSTLLTQLRSAFSGEELGFAYANREKALPMPAHTYRLGVSLGVQPEKAGPLIDDADGGTPQRFIWLPATDPDITADPPEAPKSKYIDMNLPDHETLDVPDEVRETIISARVARMQGQGDALDGHSLFAREKVAQALCFLRGGRVMTSKDWGLSGTVMKVSDRTRAGVQRVLSEKARVESEKRAVAQGHQTVISTDVVREAAVKRVGKRIVAHLKTHGETLVSKERNRFSGDDRGYFDEAMDHLVSSGAIALSEVEGVAKICLPD